MVEVQSKNINLFYGKKQGLKDINIDIQRNAITALIGPSGCGKSTYLRTLNRMNDLIEDAETKGETWIDGHNIYAKETDVNALRKKVGMVFQTPTPFSKSIFENVAYGLRVNGENSKSKIEFKVQQSLEKAALWEEVKNELRKPATSLSGGQQQRLCIARTIAVEPQIVLMDEPTSALDPLSTSKIEELIKELVKDYTIIIVTHNMQQANRVSDHTAFFYNGELIEYGATEQIFNNPTNERTSNYINGKFG